MSNKLKLASIAILIIVIVTGSLLTFSLFNSKSNKEDKLVQVNSISSVSNYVLSSSSVSSSTVSSFTNSSSSSSSQNQSSVQNTTSIIGVSSNISSVVKQESSKVVGVTSIRLEAKSTISQKLIKEILNCPTKFTAYKNYYKLGVYKDWGDSDYRYLCVPLKVVEECGNAKGGIRYGFKYASGYKLETMDRVYINKYGRDAKIESGKYYCNQYSEGGSIFGEGYPMPKCPEIIKNNNLIIQADNFQDNTFECLEVPLSSYSKEGQNYLLEQAKLQVL